MVKTLEGARPMQGSCPYALHRLRILRKVLVFLHPPPSPPPRLLDPLIIPLFNSSQFFNPVQLSLNLPSPFTPTPFSPPPHPLPLLLPIPSLSSSPSLSMTNLAENGFSKSLLHIQFTRIRCQGHQNFGSTFIRRK